MINDLSSWLILTPDPRVAVGAALYSVINKLFSDKTLRLTKSNRSETFK